MSRDRGQVHGVPGPSLSVPRRCRSPVGTTLRPRCGESSSRAEKVTACSMSAPLAALGASINRVTPAASSSMTLRGSGGRWMSGGDRMGLRDVDMGASVLGTLRLYPSVNRWGSLRGGYRGHRKSDRDGMGTLEHTGGRVRTRHPATWCTMHHGGANAQTHSVQNVLRFRPWRDEVVSHPSSGPLPRDAGPCHPQEGLDGLGDA